MAAPRQPGSLEIRAEGLWADHNCESPFEHWSIGLEAFGVAFADPEEALRSEWGERTALGFDLEFEMDAGAVDVGGGGAGYEQAAVVHGVVLVGVAGRVETIELDGRGRRAHRRGAAVPPGGEAPAAWRHRAPIRLDGAVLDRWLVDGTTGWTDTINEQPVRIG